MFHHSIDHGHVAEWLGEGLQNLLQQFEPVHRPLFSYSLWQAIVERAVFLHCPIFIAPVGSFQYDQFHLRRIPHCFE